MKKETKETIDINYDLDIIDFLLYEGQINREEARFMRRYVTAI